VEEVAAHIICRAVAGGACCSLMSSFWHFRLCLKECRFEGETMLDCGGEREGVVC